MRGCVMTTAVHGCVHSRSCTKLYEEQACCTACKAGMRATAVPGVSTRQLPSASSHVSRGSRSALPCAQLVAIAARNSSSGPKMQEQMRFTAAVYTRPQQAAMHNAARQGCLCCKSMRQVYCKHDKTFITRLRRHAEHVVLACTCTRTADAMVTCMRCCIVPTVPQWGGPNTECCRF